MSDFRLSTFDFRLSTFDFRLSTFDYAPAYGRELFYAKNRENFTKISENLNRISVRYTPPPLVPVSVPELEKPRRVSVYVPVLSISSSFYFQYFRAFPLVDRAADRVSSY